MNLEEFVAQERRIRAGVHCHDGVWWKRSSFQCCQPVYPLQEIVPRAAAPQPTKAFIRYWHVAPAESPSTGIKVRLLLHGERLKSYDPRNLEKKPRQAINKAIRNGLRVEKIYSIDNLWPDLQAIYISTAKRTQYGLPEQYYIEHKKEWQQSLREEFSLNGRDWFGVFTGSTLIAFLYSCLVEDTAIWMVTKSNAEYLQADPNDLLWSEIISYYRDHPLCTRIDAGWSIPLPTSIDWRKLKWGFERVEIPIFQRVNPYALFVLKMMVSLGKPFLGKLETTSRRNLLFRYKRIARVLEDLDDGV